MQLSISKRICLSLASLFLITSHSLFAIAEPRPLSLSDTLGKLQDTPTVQKAHSSSEETDWKKVESYSDFLPVVTATGSRLFDKKYVFTDLPFGGVNVSVPGIVPTTVYGVGFEWNIFDGLSGTNHYLAARHFAAAGHEDFDWTKFQTERQLVLLFYRALADQTLKSVAEQNLKTLQDHLEDTKLFKRAGVSTNYDVLRVEVQVSEAQSEILNSADNAEISIKKLAETLGEDNNDLQLTGSIPVLDPKLLNEVDSRPIDRKDLEALNHRVVGYTKLENSGWSHWFPRISVFGNVQNYNNLSDSWNKDFRDAYNLGVQFSWTLFDGFKDYAKQREAVEQRFQAEQSLRQAQLKTKTDIEYWKRKYLYFTTVFRARQSDIEKANESVRLAREGRKAGVRTTTDMLDAELELFRARAGSINAQVGAVEALVNYELATGQKIYDFK